MWRLEELSRWRLVRQLVWLVFLVGIAARTDRAVASASWELLRPSNSGIPGEVVESARFDPQGQLWVGARWPFWHEGGLGVWNRDEEVWKTYSNVDTPMPGEFVHDVAWAADGSVWIGTANGLVHKNGDTWTLYTTANAPLLHNVIADVAVAPNGHVWINNTNQQNTNAAIFEFDGAGVWRRYRVGAELPWAAPWNQLSDVIVDHLGHVWVANEVLNGVAEYDGTTWRLRGSDVDRFGSIQEDLAGNLWAIAGVGGYNAFYKYDHTSWFTYDDTNTPFDPTTVTTMALDVDGTFYVGNWDGQVIRTTDTGLSWSLFTTQNNFIIAVAPDPLGPDVWVATQGAVRQLDGNGTWLRAFNTYNTGMPDYWVSEMRVDRDQTFWIATGEAGLSWTDGKRWRNWGAHNAGSEPWPFMAEQAYGIYQDHTGAIWVGSNGVGRVNRDTGTIEIWDWRNVPAFGVTGFPYFAEDARQRLFAVAEDGRTFRFDPALSTWTREPVTPYAPMGVPGVAADSHGNVWVAGWFALHRWDGTSWTTVGEDWPLFDMGGLDAFAIGPNDVLWMGTAQGLLRWDGTRLETFDPTNSPMRAYDVQDIAFRSDGLMALSTSDFQSVTPFPNGVAIVHGDIHEAANWDVYSYGETPLPHYQLGCIAFDARGRLWISAESEAVAILDTGVPVDTPPEADGAPARWALHAPVPNPFNPSTSLRYEVPSGGGPVRLQLFDTRGRLVRTLVEASLPAGPQVARWNGRDHHDRAVPSGIYFARLRARGFESVKKLVLAR